jgi:two-component system chemotaxis response regulator CheY
MATNPLQQYRILIADADQQLSLVLKLMLGKMGFTNVLITRSGQDALALLKGEHFDFLITELDTQHIDGISLINRIRRDETSPNPTLPIIMLTGHAEQTDVATARDNGINEYVVKPFSAHTIYARLERMVEHPRNFVVAESFVGPDRRHLGTPPPGVSNRRSARVKPEQMIHVTAKKLKPQAEPKLWLPDYSLKKKLGNNVTLATLITPAVLTQAQASIEAISNDSLQWIKDNLSEIMDLSKALPNEKNPAPLIAELGQAALTLNSRAGTFGYGQTSQVAYMLYLFCRNQIQPGNPAHHTIIQKHIEVLQVTISSDIRGKADPVTNEVVAALRRLVKKYTA